MFWRAVNKKRWVLGTQNKEVQMKKTMKRMLCGLMVLAMLFSLSAGLAVSAFATDDGATTTGKTASGVCGEAVTYSYYDATPNDYSPSGVLTITGIGAMYDYQQTSSMSVDTPWFEADYRFDIQKVVIMPGVTSIGAFAFYNLTKCTEVVIPIGVVSIGEWAFAYTAITKVDLPVTLKSVRHFAFFNSKLPSDGANSTCAGFPSIDNEKVGNTSTNHELINDLDSASKDNIIVEASGKLCDGIEWRYSSTSKTLTLSSAYDGVINKNIYEMIDMQMTLENPQPWPWSSYMSSIQNVYITKGISNIGQFVLAQLPALQSVTVGEHIETIEKNAFNSDGMLRGNIILPEATTTIEDEAFLGCTGPITVITPNTKEEVGNTFSKVGNTGVVYQFANEGGSTPSGPDAATTGLLANDTIRWTYIPVAGMLFVEPVNAGGKVNMPHFASSSEAPWDAFDDEIKVVYIQPGIAEIGKYNFADLPNLTNVSFPSEDLTRINSYAFGNDVSLTSVAFPKSVAMIYQYAFYGCNGLTSAVAANSFMMIDRMGNEKLYSLLFGGGGGTTPTPPPSTQPTTGSCGLSAIWTYDKTTKTLTISGSGPMTNYNTPSETPWNYYMDEIETLIVTKDITIVGSHALDGADALKTVSLPSSLMGVGTAAFKACPAITTARVDKVEGTLTISTENKDLTDHLIYNSASTTPTNGNCGASATWVYDPATKLLVIAGSGTMTDYETPALTPWSSYMTSIEGVYVSEGITTVGKNALCGATALKQVTLPSTLMIVATSAFDNCPAINDATVERAEGTLMIGNNNKDLTDHLRYKASPSNPDNPNPPVNPNPGTGNDDGGSIPDTGLTWTYSPATHALNIKGAGQIPNYSAASPAPWAKYASEIEAITVQEGITAIGSYAFANMPKLVDVYLPQSLKTIGDNAFNGCTSVKTVKLPDGLTSLGKGAFRNCSSLTAIEIPAGVRVIDDYTFCDCVSLESVKLNKGLERIGYRAFYNCKALKLIEFPTTLTEIGSEAFWGCSGLEGVVISSSPLTIGKDAFAGCTSLVKVILDKVSEPTVDTGNENLTDHYVASTASGTLANGVQWVVDRVDGTLTFFGSGEVVREEAWLDEMKYVDTVIFDNGITGIEAGLLKDDANVEYVRMANTVTSIGEGAFERCRNLERVILSGGLTTLGKSAFAGCTALTDIALPNSLTVIPESAFTSCTAMTAVTLGNAVTSIGKNAFDNCTSLREIVIPATVTTLSEGAFKDCTALSKVTLSGGKLPPLQKGIFVGCSGIQNVNFNGSKAQWDTLTANADDEIKNAKINYTVSFTVKYVYVGGPLNGQLVQESVTYVGKPGEAFTITVPSVSFYTPKATSLNQVFASVDQEITVEFVPNEYTVTIEYVDANGNKLSEDGKVNLTYGDSIKLSAANIPGYTAKLGSQEVNVNNGNTTIRFEYTINKYSYTVEYWNTRTETLLGSKTFEVDYMTVVTLKGADMPMIKGYTLTDAEATYTIDGIKDNEQVIKVYYDPTGVELTIEYYNDKNVKIAEDKKVTVFYGDKLFVESPVVKGMKPAAAVEIEAYNGEGPVIKVVYEREEYTITVNFLMNSLTGEKRHEPYTAVAKFEDKFVFDLSKFEQYAPDTGYEVKAPVLTIESVSEDAELNIVYTLRRLTVTVHYVDENGNKIAEDFTQVYDYGTKVSHASPEVKGMTPDLAVYIVDSLTGDVEKTIAYTRRSYQVTVVFQEAGTVDYKMFPDFTTTVKYGDNYVFLLSEHKDYINPAYVTHTEALDFGTIEEDKVLTLTYSPKELKLTVEYTNADGTVVAKDELTVLAGRAYEIAAKTLEGYKTTLAKSGVMGVDNMTIIIPLEAETSTPGGNTQNPGDNTQNPGDNTQKPGDNDNEKGGTGKVVAVILIIVLVLGGGGAAFYFLYLKKPL